jgi:hypothetical protein
MNTYTLEGKIVIKGNPVIHLFTFQTPTFI